MHTIIHKDTQNKLECVRAYSYSHIHTHAWIRTRVRFERASGDVAEQQAKTVQSHTIKSSLFSRWFNTIFVYNFIIIFPSLLLFSFADSGFSTSLKLAPRTHYDKNKNDQWWSWMSNKKNNLLTAGSYLFGLIFYRSLKWNRTMSAQFDCMALMQ